MDSNQSNRRVSISSAKISQVNSNFMEHNSSESKSSERKTPPPPYTEIPQSNMEGSLSDSNKNHRIIIPVPAATTPATAVYSVPTDLTEGLSNPVFDNTLNPDGDADSLENSKIAGPTSSNETLSTSSVDPAHTSFTSLDSDGKQYASSQTTLYCKDKLEKHDFDAEKGKPSSGRKDAMSKKKGTDKEYKGMKKYLGLLLTLSASFCFSVVVLFVKILKDYGFDAYGASFWRYTGTVIPTIPLLCFYECGPGTKKQSSVFGSVWPVWENENWKTWIGLVVI